MSHIFTEGGDGASEHSLADAVSNAIADAIKGHDFGGDHICNFVIVMDGYVFDGKKYRVKLRVLIYDFELAQEDYYHDLQKYEKERHKMDVREHYYAALMHGKRFSSKHDSFLEELRHELEKHHDIGHLDITMVAPQSVHDHLAQELGYQPNLKPVYPAPHTDLADPTLGPGSAGGHKDNDEAA